MASATTNPAVRWAQRSTGANPSHIYYNKVILTITVPGVEQDKYKVDVSDSGITFSASSASANYSFQLDFFAPVNGAESKFKHVGSDVEILIPKKDETEEYWPRLSKEKGKLHYLSTDFDRWVDEDEQDEEEQAPAQGYGDMPGMDFSALGGGMPGMGGFGGMDGMPDMSNFDMSNLPDLGGDDGDDEPLTDEEAADVKEAEAGAQAEAEAASSGPKITELPDTDKESS